MQHRALVLAACAALLSACSSSEQIALPSLTPGSASAAGAPPIEPSLDIAFMSVTDFDHSDLYLVRADGSGLRRILTVPGQAFEPDWSPDGDSLVFTWDAHPAGTSPFWIVRADGTGLRPVSSDDTYGYGARWSPDGQSFASFRMVTDDIYDIAITRTDGSDLRFLLNGARNVLGISVPAWSRDGQQIAFESSVDFNPAGVFVANLDGSGLHQLTQTIDDFSPRWSPDGSRLTYVQYGGFGANFTFSVMVANGDGSSPQALTTGTRDYEPSWSPNGKTIAFARLQRANDGSYYCSIFKIPAAGGAAVEVTPGLFMPGCGGVVWRPRRLGAP